MKILAVNQYYTPDIAGASLLLGSLCEGLAGKGFQVDVICGKPSYTDDAPEAAGYEEKENLSVKRISIGNVKGRSTMRIRIQGYLGFLFSGLRAVWKQAKRQKYDAVFTLSNPPIVGLIGVLLKKFKGIKYVYILHDIHPDILIRTGRLKKGVITWFWDIINKVILSGADRIVVLGSKMEQYLADNKNVPIEKIEVIHNWPITDIAPLPKNNKFRRLYSLEDDDFVVLYAGNMGVLHNLEWVLDAAEVNVNTANVKYVFVGEGEKKKSMIHRVEKKELGNVMFLPYQDEEILNQMLCAADVCIVALEPEMTGLAVPSKTYPILAAGRPILAITAQDDDIADIVRQWECGWVAQSSEELINTVNRFVKQPDLLEQYGKHARLAYEKAFSRQNALQMYDQLFRNLCANE